MNLSIIVRCCACALVLGLLGVGATILWGFHIEVVVYTLLSTAWAINRLVMFHLRRKLESDTDGHYHRDSTGVLIRCYHKCRTTFSDVSFWLGVTLSFPLEHFLWEHVWPFKLLTQFLGL